MRRIIISITAVLFLSPKTGAVPVLNNGFATWSEGDQMERTLHYRAVSNGELGPVKKICDKGEAGGDIQGVISFDGKWIAFARKREAVCPKLPGQWNGNGEDDYHKFHCWSIFVARLDVPLPTTPIKVADEGYWPSWGDDSLGPVKTLYFGIYTKGEIWKATINNVGSIVSPAIKQAAVPEWVNGDHHMQCSPNGELVAIRLGARVHVVGLNGNPYFQSIASGEHPSWFADSKHLNIISRIYDINGTKVGTSGKYHFGSSSNMKWAITLTQGLRKNQQNNGWQVGFGPVEYNTADSAIKKIGPYDSPTITEKGNWPDIHDFDSSMPVNPVPEISVPTNFILERKGGQLIVNTAFTGKHTVELFDVDGVRRVNAVQFNSSRTVLSVNDYPRGVYMLRVNAGGKSHQKKLVMY